MIRLESIVDISGIQRDSQLTEEAGLLMQQRNHNLLGSTRRLEKWKLLKTDFEIRHSTFSQNLLPYVEVIIHDFDNIIPI
jgi:hypothetical protein